MAAQILSLTYKRHLIFGERTSFEVITQIRPDISEYTSFTFYSWIWHWDEQARCHTIGRWLGVVESVGPIMTFLILPISCIPIPRSSIISIPEREYSSDIVKQMMSSFDATVNAKIGNSKKYLVDDNVPVITVNKDTDSFRRLDEVNTTPDIWDGDPNFLPYAATSEEAAMEQLDEYIGTQILFSTKTGPELIKVTSRKRDGTGHLIGTKYSRPTLDSRIYNIQFPDGHYEQYTTNVLAEALFDSCDDDGYDTGFISEISGHCSDATVIRKPNDFYLSKNSNRCPKVTSKGWEIQITWKDNYKTWIPIALAKNSCPDLLVEYAKNAKIYIEPAFHWWVSHVLRKKTRFVSKMRAKLHKSNRKFGIAIPHIYDEAIKFDKANGNKLW